MAEFSSSPAAQVLTRLAQLHRTEQAPPAARARFAEQLAQLQAAPPAPPAPARARWAVRAGAGLSLLALAAAALIWRLGEREHVLPSREGAPAPRAAEPVSLSGLAVPGSLRWRAAGQNSTEGECLYRFALEPEGSAPIEVRWRQCQFPAQLREHAGRRRSPITGPLRVNVTGHWSEPGQLDATELRVLP